MIHAKQNIILIDGPSGCGKTTIALKLQEQLNGLAKYIASTTIRPKRDGEVEGREHFFPTKEEFLLKKQNNEFLGYYEIYENCYGIEKFKIKNNSSNVTILTYHAFENEILKDLGDLNVKVIKILILPEDGAALKTRIIRRNEKISQNAIKERLEKYTHLESIKDKYDYVVYNKQNCLNETIKEIQSITNAEFLSEK